jgi:hypothetical protein
MSNAEYLSRPFPLLAKLAAMLRNIAPVGKAFARLGTLLRRSKKSGEPLVSQFVGEIPDVAEKIPEIVDETPAVADEAPDITDETPEVTDEAPEATDKAPGVTDELRAIIDEIPDVSEASEPPVIMPAETPLAPECTLSAREQLIRRRWAETGIKMWAGKGALNIQGSAELLPLKPGGTRREYDRLEFRLIAGVIVCEGVVVDPLPPRK